MDPIVDPATAPHDLRFGGIVLCGGKSKRMGRPKAWLPFGDEVLLQRVVRILRTVVSPVVVVAAVAQDLPALPADVLIARDDLEDRGPVGGVAAGFAALRGLVDGAFVCACDLPLLKPEVVSRICGELGDYDIAVPVESQFPHPLAAAYRATVEDKARKLLEADRLRAIYLWEGARVNQIPVDSLRDVDPHLKSFRNANTPEEFEAVQQLARNASEGSSE